MANFNSKIINLAIFSPRWYTTEEPEYREPTITNGAMLSGGVGGAGEASRKP